MTDNDSCDSVISILGKVQRIFGRRNICYSKFLSWIKIQLYQSVALSIAFVFVSSYG